jgi:hypothetical protein
VADPQRTHRDEIWTFYGAAGHFEAVIGNMDPSGRSRAGLNLGILLDVCQQNALGWMDPLERSFSLHHPAAAAPLRNRRRGAERRELNGSCWSTIFSSLRPIDAAKSVAWMSGSTAPRLSENPASASVSGYSYRRVEPRFGHHNAEKIENTQRMRVGSDLSGWSTFNKASRGRRYHSAELKCET